MWRRVDFNLVGYITGQRTDSDFLGLGFTRDPGYSRFDVATSYRVDRNVSLFVRAGNVSIASIRTRSAIPRWAAKSAAA